MNRDTKVVPVSSLRTFLLLSIRKELEASGTLFKMPTPEEIDVWLELTATEIPWGIAEILAMFTRIQECISSVYQCVGDLLKEMHDEKELRMRFDELLEQLDKIYGEIFLSDSEMKGELEIACQTRYRHLDTLLLMLWQEGLLNERIVDTDGLPTHIRREVMD